MKTETGLHLSGYCAMALQVEDELAVPMDDTTADDLHAQCTPLVISRKGNVRCSCRCHDWDTLCHECGEPGCETGSPECDQRVGAAITPPVVFDPSQCPHDGIRASSNIEGWLYCPDCRAHWSGTMQDVANGKRLSRSADSGGDEDDAKPKRARKPKTEKVESPCQCGCGGVTMSKFVPGHDMKLKSKLKKQADAAAIIEAHARGWKLAIEAPDRARMEAEGVIAQSTPEQLQTWLDRTVAERTGD